MGYQPFLISNFRTGLQTNQQPWLVFDDAQTVIYDGYIRNGVIYKRDGYNGYADGLRGGAPYCESRMVRRVDDEATGETNNGAVLGNFTLSETPIRRGSVTIEDGVESHTDDGVGGFSTAAAGSVDYTTGEVSGFQFNASSGNAVTATYDYHPGNPVMMVANFVASDNDLELIVADTQFVNRYNSTTNRLDDITSRVYTGGNSNFFDWVSYPKTTDAPRIIFTNNTDIPQQYDGTTVTDFLASFKDGTQVTNELIAVGDGSTVSYTHTTVQMPVVQGSVTVNATVSSSGVSMTDDGNGNLSGDAGTGTIDYVSGQMTLTFSTAPDNATNIEVTYTPSDGYIEKALHVLNFKDRLIFLRTTESGTVYPQRIRISGLGNPGGDDFRTTATGAGVIDIPDQSWISGWDYNRDDVIIYTNRSTWVLKFTGSDIVPFSINQIENTRGNLAPFAPISYLGYTKGFSPRGFTVTDGYQVQRYDEKIPDYSFQDINVENFELCFSGDVDDEDNHYLIHPSPGESESDRILVHNYEEGNFAVHRIPLSCMGKFRESATITWNDLLTLYPDATDPDTDVWNGQFSQDYSSWENFSYDDDQRISIGGGHNGEIWRMNKDEAEDNPVRIRNITTSSSDPLQLQITTDYNNYKIGDYIYFGGVEGADEINGKQAPIISQTNAYTFTVEFDPDDPASISTYTANTGSVSRSIPFEIVTKNFNPYVEANNKVRCGYFYLRANSSDTSIIDIEGNTAPCVLTIQMLANDNTEYPVQIRSTDLDLSNIMTNRDGRTNTKKWSKSFPNLTGDFIQFKILNTQAGSQIRIDAYMLGMRPVGRIL